LEHLDAAMLRTIRRHHLPGGALAVCKDGRLVYARGFGYADLAAREPVTPTSRFNLASCTKPFTAAAVLHLADAGKLRLDDPVFRRLKGVRPPAGAEVDPRIYKITARQLLYHASGLPRDLPGKARDATLEEYVGRAMATRLVFDPGTRSEYSNIAFLVLRLVVAQAAGEDYEAYTVEKVLRPAGVKDVALAAHKHKYLSGEVRRYRLGSPEPVPGGQDGPPGGGCWVASAVEAARFLTAVDSSRGERMFSERAFREMVAPPPPPWSAKRKDGHPGLGWDVARQEGKEFLYHKNGSIAGVATYMEHRPGGVDWVVFFNASPGAEKDEEEGGRAWREGVIEAVAATKRWPAGDLFRKYR
jgi:N-acyl-D-amino-acid deacylase